MNKKTTLCSKLKSSFGKSFTCKNKKGNVYSLTNKKKECLHLELNDDNSLRVQSLQKCPDTSGSATMIKLEKIGKEMGLDRIELADGQWLELECGKAKTFSILVKYINILADGESWYNKLGYKSKSHEAELKHNKSIGQMNAGVFVQKVINFHKKSPYKRNDYWGSLDKTVKDYFSGIKEALKTELPTKQFSIKDCVKYKWLEYLTWRMHSMLFSKSKSKTKLRYDNLNLSLKL